MASATDIAAIEKRLGEAHYVTYMYISSLGIDKPAAMEAVETFFQANKTVKKLTPCYHVELADRRRGYRWDEMPVPNTKVRQLIGFCKSEPKFLKKFKVDFIEDWALLMKSDCLPKLSYSLVASHTQPRRRPKGTFEADGSFRHVTPEELAAEDDSEPSGEDGKPGKSGVIQLSSSSSENKEPVLGGAASSSSASRGGPPNAMAASGAGGAAAKPKQSQFGAVTPKSNFPSAAGQSSQFAKSPALKPSQFGKSPAPLKPSQFGASKPAFPPAQPSPVASTVMPAKLPKTPSSAPPPGATDAGNGGSQPDGPTSKKRTYASAFGSASPKQSPGQAVQPAVLPAAVPAAASPRLTREELEKKKATAKAKRAAVLAKKQAEAASVGPASAGSSASGLSA